MDYGFPTIKQYLMDIYTLLKKELEPYSGYCELKLLRFDQDFIPDYTRSALQKLYTLRYSYAYASSYVALYTALLAMSPTIDQYNILSIGCGNGIDAYAFDYASKQVNRLVPWHYTGIDRVNWHYRLESNKNMEYKQQDALVWLESEAFRHCHNIIIFPMSISEFSKSDLISIATYIGVMKSKQIFIAGTFRQSHLQQDTSRYENLIRLLYDQYAYCPVQEHVYHDPIRMPIRHLLEGFEYPIEVLEYLRQLTYMCPTYRKNGHSCMQDCVTLCRNPILTTGYTHLKIVELKWW